MIPASLHPLLDFDDPADIAMFAAVDDAVMGGVSSSRLVQAAPGIAAFEGIVSLENRGGFASIRSQARDWRLAGAVAFVLRLRSDGKRYRFNLRQSRAPAAFRHEASLELPAGAWSELRLPLAAFRAKAFGQQLPLTAAPDPSRIRRIGFMISDRQPGPFRLEVDWIAAELS